MFQPELHKEKMERKKVSRRKKFLVEALDNEPKPTFLGGEKNAQIKEILKLSPLYKELSENEIEAKEKTIQQELQKLEKEKEGRSDN